MTDKTRTSKERGSILILTIIAVLILSVLVTGLLDVGTTEIYTTQNYQLSKSAYYAAVQGLEEVRNLIYNYPDAESVQGIKRYSSAIEGPTLPGESPGSGTTQKTEGLERFYITGTQQDMEGYLVDDVASVNPSALSPIGQLKGFEAPPLPAFSMGGSASIAPVVWKVTVTARVKGGNRTAYSEIVSGVYSILTVSY